MSRSSTHDSVRDASAFVPATRRLSVLRGASRDCRGCDLYCNATQTVFGEGPAKAIAIFVGEQPGDQEDRAGKPFVGAAGRLLDDALAQVGIDRKLIYVTNAVKHFKFVQRGKRRIHSKPSAREINACKPWLAAEVQTIKPRLVVALGATAAQAMMGAKFRVMQDRGKIIQDTPWAQSFLATVHPSSILRIPDHDSREEARRQFLNDLRVAAKLINKL